MMKQSILTRLTLLVSIVIFISLVVISFATYQMTYLKVKESAGIELYGCANITTGLLEEEDIRKLLSLTTNEAVQLGEKISWTVEHKPIFSNQYIMAMDGTVLVTDKSSELQGIHIADKAPIQEKVITTLKETKSPTYSNVYDYAGMKRLSGYAPIFEDHDPNKDLIAISVIDFDASILTERTWTIVRSTIIVGILSLLIAAIIIVYYVRRTISPLKTLTKYTKQIADGDLSIENISLKSQGEIRILQENFNVMVQSLRTAIEKTVSSSTELSTSTNDLSSNIEEVTKITEDVANTFQEVAEFATHQESKAEKIHHALTSVLKETQYIGERLNKQAENISKTTFLVKNGLNHVSNSMKQMKNIHGNSEKLVKTMEELQEKSIRANDILSIIKNIAKQTNLLALNASIESSRAGEHGKGFAVVAEQIRSLAVETAESIENIHLIISEIQKKMDEAVTLTEEGTKTVNVGLTKVEEAGHTFSAIHQATENSDEEMDEILQATNNIKDNIIEVTEQMSHINDLSKEIAAQMQVVVAASEEQTASMEEISAATQRLARMAEELKQLSKQFKME